MSVSRGCLHASIAIAVLSAATWASADWSYIDLIPSGFDVSNRSMANGDYSGHQFGYGNGASTGYRDHALMWSGTANSLVDIHPDAFENSQILMAGDGHEVGFARPSGTNESHAIEWNSDGSYTELNRAGYTYTAAYSISGDQVVGQGELNGSRRALLWNTASSAPVDLTPISSADCAAYGVENGVQVGYSTNHAMRWTGSASSAVDMHPPGFSSSVIRAIDNDTEAGSVQLPSGAYHPYIWFGASNVGLDLMPTGYISGGLAAISNGWEIGDTTDAAYGNHLMLWHSSPVGAIDLGALLPSSYQLNTAMLEGVYSSGDHVEVVGSVYNSSTYQFDAILWTNGPVPEPPSAAVLFLLAAPVVRRRRKETARSL